MEFFLYEGRHGERVLVLHNREGWDWLRSQQDSDNRCSPEEALANSDLQYGGSFEQGYFYVDDGGSISTIKLTPT